MRKVILLSCALLAVFSLAMAQEGNFHLDREYAIKPNGTLRLNCSDAKVQIVGSDRATAHVKIDHVEIVKGLSFGHREFTVDVTEDEGDVNIRERSNSVQVGMVGYYEQKYSILVEVPAGVNLIVRGDDGDFQITSVNGEISLSLDDADVTLRQCKGKKFDFRLDDGDVVMEGGQGILRVDGDDADVTISGASFSQVDADIDDGEISIETSLSDGGIYNIDAQDGLVQLMVRGGGGTFDIRHDDGRISADGGFTTVESLDSRSLLKLGTGTARVDIHTDDARVRLASR